jgi:O-antigen/teichoic acid export membrane protein
MYIGALALGMSASLVISRSLGPSGRGSVITLVIWAQLLGWTAAFSLDKAIVVLSRPDAVPALNPDAGLALSRRIVAFLSAPIILVSLILGHVLFHDWAWAWLLAVGALLTAHGELSAGWLLARANMPAFILYRLGQPVLYFSGCTGVAIIFRHSSVDNRLAPMAAAAVVSLVIPVLLISIFTPWTSPKHLTSSRLLSFAASTQVANAMQYLNSRLDILTLSVFSSPKEVGLYSVGLALGQATVLLGSAGIIRGIMGNSSSLDRNGTVATALLGILVAIASPFVIPFLFGSAFAPSIRVAQIIALGGTVNYALLSSSGRLLGAGRPWLMALSEGCGAVMFAGGIAISRNIDVVALASVLSYAASLIVAQLCLVKLPKQLNSYPGELPPIPE